MKKVFFLLFIFVATLAYGQGPYDGLYKVNGFINTIQTPSSNTYEIIEKVNFITISESEESKVLVTILNPITQSWQSYFGTRNENELDLSSIYDDTDYGLADISSRINIIFDLNNNGNLEYILVLDPSVIISGSNEITFIPLTMKKIDY